MQEEVGRRFSVLHLVGGVNPAIESGEEPSMRQACPDLLRLRARRDAPLQVNVVDRLGDAVNRLEFGGECVITPSPVLDAEAGRESVAEACLDHRQRVLQAPAHEGRHALLGRDRQSNLGDCLGHHTVGDRLGVDKNSVAIEDDELEQADEGTCQAVGVSLLPDYSRQAEHYDETRGASPSVLRPLYQALKGAPGRLLADIGGGTGNYALALKGQGWQPVVVDRSAEMLARAAAKGIETVKADAQRLPFEDESFDAVTMISMLHHVEDRGAALAEAQRILGDDGRLVLMGFTREDAASLWIVDYFPSSQPWMEATHPPLAAILEELPGAHTFNFVFEDMEDASLAALSANPDRVLEAAESGATSYFERLRRDHSDELEAGLSRLREDIAAGHAERRAGTATVLSWTKRL